MGDVEKTTYSAEPEPCGTLTRTVDPLDADTDIVALSARHTEDVVEMSVRFRGLTRWGHRCLSFDLETDRRAFEIRVVKWDGDKRLQASLFKARTPPVATDECGSWTDIDFVRHCPDLEVAMDLERGRVTVLWPRGPVSASRAGSGWEPATRGTSTTPCSPICGRRKAPTRQHSPARSGPRVRRR